MTMPRKVAVIGAGEIGVGWAALCVSAGWPVAMFDMNPRTTERAFSEVPRRARALVALERAAVAIGSTVLFKDGRPYDEARHRRDRFAARRGVLMVLCRAGDAVAAAPARRELSHGPPECRRAASRVQGAVPRSPRIRLE